MSIEMYFKKYDKTAMSLTGQIAGVKMCTIILADTSKNLNTCIWQIYIYQNSQTPNPDNMHTCIIIVEKDTSVHYNHVPKFVCIMSIRKEYP